jgi:hypothetical protein
MSLGAIDAVGRPQIIDGRSQLGQRMGLCNYPGGLSRCLFAGDSEPG